MKKRTAIMNDALAWMARPGARLVIPMGYLGGGYVGSVYVRGGTFAALEARGLIERDEIEYGPERIIRTGFGKDAKEQSIRPIRRTFYRLSEAGRAAANEGVPALVKRDDLSESERKANG